MCAACSLSLSLFLSEPNCSNSCILIIVFVVVLFSLFLFPHLVPFISFQALVLSLFLPFKKISNILLTVVDFMSSPCCHNVSPVAAVVPLLFLFHSLVIIKTLTASSSFRATRHKNNNRLNHDKMLITIINVTTLSQM